MLHTNLVYLATIADSNQTPWNPLPSGEQGPFILENQPALSDSNPAGWRAVRKGQGRGTVAPWDSLGLGPFWQCRQLYSLCTE